MVLSSTFNECSTPLVDKSVVAGDASLLLLLLLVISFTLTSLELKR